MAARLPSTLFLRLSNKSGESWQFSWPSSLLLLLLEGAVSQPPLLGSSCLEVSWNK